MAQYNYLIRVDVASLIGGSLNVIFWDQGADILSNPHTVFYGVFGGLTAGIASSWGTAWLNYDVRWMMQNNWEATFQANFLPVASNVNLWGLSGDVIGNTAAGGLGVTLGVVGGRGYFGPPKL